MPTRPAAANTPFALALQVARSPCILFLVAFGGAIVGSMIGGHMGQPMLHPYSLVDTNSDVVADVEPNTCPKWTLSVLAQR